MGQITNYVSVKNIINSLYSTTGVQDSLAYNDLIEWSYHCLALSDFSMQYLDKVVGWKEDSRLDYDNYVFPMPEDFHQLTAMSINGIKARPSSSDFINLLDGNCCGANNVPLSNANQFVDGWGNEVNSSIGLELQNFYPDGIGFNIKNGIATTDLKKGKVCMAYKAFPIDCDGFPLIPANMKIQKMVEMYLRAKIDYQIWRADPDSRGKRALYDDSEREYCFYAASAKGSVLMPDVHEMENIKNALLRLKPRIQEYDSYFQNLNSNTGFR